MAAFQNNSIIADENEHEESFKFIQLYTSKSYDTHKSKLVFPAGSGVCSNVNKHVLSPQLIHAVCRSNDVGTQIIWANSDDGKLGSNQRSNGLLGRSDVLLRTAIGMPFAIDNEGNTCVAVMFSPYSLKHSEEAIEHLKFISLSATNRNIPCLLPMSENLQLLNGVNAYKRQNEVCAYSNNERTICTVSKDEANLSSFKENLKKALGKGVEAHFLSLNGDNSKSFGQSCIGSNALMVSPTLAASNQLNTITSREQSRTFSFDDTMFSLDDESNYAVWSTIMNTDLIDSLVGDCNLNSNACDKGIISKVRTHSFTEGGLQHEAQVDFRNDINMHQDKLFRLEEFAQGFLGMSVFDIADVWMPDHSNENDEVLKHVLSVTKDPKNDDFLTFKDFSRLAKIPLWSGAVGRAFVTFQTIWESTPEQTIDSNRAHAFYQAKINTVLSVPVLNETSKSVSVLSFYSQAKVDRNSYVVKFIEKAVKLVWCGLETITSHLTFDENLWAEIDSFTIGKIAANESIQTEFSRKRSNEEFPSSNFKVGTFILLNEVCNK